MTATATVHTTKLSNGVEVFYREAGSPSKPVFLLLHGYPTTSNMFRNLIPALAPHYHVIAPDLPGFGWTKTPSGFEHGFANMAATVELLLTHLKISKFYVYLFDYGAPTGFRLALNDPKRILGIVAQNGNAYVEGVDNPFWEPIRAYWKAGKDNKTYIKALTDFNADPANIWQQYTQGFGDASKVDPAAPSLDQFLLSREGQYAIQVALFFDYGSNVELYPQFQEFLRTADIPVLLPWGKNDYIFPPAGAEPYKRDVKNLKIKYYDTGHFALEEYNDEIAADIIEFFAKN